MLGKVAALTSFGLLAGAGAVLAAGDPPKVCSSCEQWNQPQEPFRIFGNTYYVGVAGLTSILIASRDGLIVLDGALPQSADTIAGNIRKLGFRLEDVRLIVSTHTHYDHVGGIAELQRRSNAIVAASPASRLAFLRGEPTEDDPQYGFGKQQTLFPPVAEVRVIQDSEVLRVGPLAITAHFTPGHTPGGTTWTWRSCEDKHCVDIVYADSLNAVSAPGFRFTDETAHPGRVEQFGNSMARVAALPCDVLLSPHPELFDLESKLERRRQRPRVNPFIDPQGCKAYTANARKRLDRRIAEEQAAATN